MVNPARCKTNRGRVARPLYPRVLVAPCFGRARRAPPGARREKNGHTAREGGQNPAYRTRTAAPCSLRLRFQPGEPRAPGSASAAPGSAPGKHGSASAEHGSLPAHSARLRAHSARLPTLRLPFRAPLFSASGAPARLQAGWASPPSLTESASPPLRDSKRFFSRTAKAI